jgi:hypothetical protein
VPGNEIPSGESWTYSLPTNLVKLWKGPTAEHEFLVWGYKDGKWEPLD